MSVRVTVTGTAIHRCPYADEIDTGTAEITFDVPAGDAPELHDLAQRLVRLADREVSHEDFTRDLLTDLAPDAVRVVTRWQTAGLAVVCEATRNRSPE